MPSRAGQSAWRPRWPLIAAYLACLAVCVPRLVSPAPQSVAAQGHIIEKIDRQIDLTKQWAFKSEILTIKVAAKGDGAAAVALCDLKQKAERRALIKVSLVKDGKQTPLDTEDTSTVEDAPNDVSCILAHLPTEVTANQAVELKVLTYATRVMTPNPEKIFQSETQRMVYEDNTLVLSPYRVETQTTTVKVPSSDISDFSKMEPSKESGSTVVYGPYTGIGPFERHNLRVHFAHNAPFVEAIKLVREIQVSEWGNVYVEETYNLKHTGAALQGTWSRLDYQQDPGRYGASACKELKAKLPGNAHSIYFRDEIGNVSSSHVRQSLKNTEVLLLPRFPLFGGWKINFVFGYSVPLNGVLWDQEDGFRRLGMAMGSSIQDLVVDELEIRVVLPQGASDIEVEQGAYFDKLTVADRKHSYLDTIGRPVAAAVKYNVVPKQAQTAIVVKYRISGLAQMYKPLLLVGVVFLLFGVAIFYVRFEMKLAKGGWRKGTTPQQKQDSCLQKAKALLKERQGTRDEMEDLIKEMQRTKSTEQSAKFCKAMEMKAAATTKQLKDLVAELEKTECKEIAAIRELLAKERKLQDKYNVHCTSKIQHARSTSPKKDEEKKIAQGDAVISESTEEVVRLSTSVLGPY
ncbi:unnamed protein product [Ostreobium quekettii]|uniref:Dolichyl-diphosphooligosaccharide--protein glycosyltransferase subunit 1 n=1 Tax=Ostreobium quekettii TaxID=121088 RepID=A0A8S1J075_9CHLO|nr:unnamed protein product [Ostreobium quekettii]|eukprot:evm.model.scf_600EXC.4 EVM.evm.TU.scf_600EXC.4   scf_600EXC:34942-43358(-)